MTHKSYLLSYLIAGSIALFASPKIGQSQDWQGYWQGKFESELVTLDVAWRIGQDDSGNLTCSMDIPGQEVYDFAADSVWVSNDSINIRWLLAGAMFKGGIDDHDILKGEWTQANQVVTLTLQRSEEGAFSRPQDPSKPYPYQSVDVQFPSAGDTEVLLAGTLTYPSSGDPKASVILVTGSGPQNRNEEIFGHKPFLVLADHLTRNGYAVLRYDDRGTAQSQGVYNDAVLGDFISDARGAVNYLREQGNFDAGEIGIYGHSEGGSVAISVAARGNEVDFIILSASPGTANEQLLIDQTMMLARDQGMTDESVTLDTTYARAVYQLMRSSSLGALDTAKLRKLADQYFEDSEAIQTRFGTKANFFNSQLAMATNPWFFEFISFNPAPLLRKITCPVLAINGTLDLQVAAEANLDAIEAALRKGKCKDFKVHAFEGLNHMLQPAESGGIDEYGQIEITIDEEVLAYITNWLDKRFR